MIWGRWQFSQKWFLSGLIVQLLTSSFMASLGGLNSSWYERPLGWWISLGKRRKDGEEGVGGQDGDRKEIRVRREEGGGRGQMRVRQPQWLTNYLTVLFTSHALPLSYLGLKRQQPSSSSSSSSQRTPADREIALCKLSVFSVQCCVRIMWSSYCEEKRTNAVLQ